MGCPAVTDCATLLILFWIHRRVHHRRKEKELLLLNNRMLQSQQNMLMSAWPKTTLVCLLMSILTLGSCVTAGIRPTIRHNLQPAPGPTKILAVYMPWFGDPSHINVGYSSQDPRVLRRQIEEARNVGISAFLVDWYGDRRPFLDKSYQLLQRAAKENHFQVALMYNEEENNTENSTEDAIAALSKAYSAYIGPGAPDREAYLTYNGRPVIVIFPKGGHTNWNLLRQSVNSWSVPPLLFYKDQPPAEFAAAFDGYYAWVHPSDKGWSPDGSDWGQQYLESFYKNMKGNNPSKITMGAAWPGFDDTKAPWSLNRHMDARCGKTLEETLQLYHRYYDSSAPLPFLLIETWNDYEEGTAIEHSKFENCSTK